MSTGRALLYALTLGALALTARAVLVAPPPMWVALLAVGIYVVALGLGSMIPRLEMFGSVLWQVPEAGRKVALTFDDGPHPISTALVLDLLKARGVHATFFVLGKRAIEHPELLRRMVDEGHTIGLHSWDHFRAYALLSSRQVAADIRRCQDAVEAATGARPLWFRPPVGQASPRTFGGVDRMGAEVVGWSVRSRDGVRVTTAGEVVARVTKGLRPGAIVLLHDAWERPSAESTEEPPAGVRALGEVLDACESQGLVPVNLDELVAAGLNPS